MQTASPPISNDSTVEVALTSSSPKSEEYDQADRGRPVRGGRVWRVEVPAGGKAKVEFAYSVTLPSKSEIVGGNRRD